MLTKQELEGFKKELDESQKPYYFYDDDPDGIASSLLVYRYKQSGYGMIVKARSILTMQFVEKAVNYGADRIFVLDIPQMDDEVLEKINLPISWLDHHDIIKVKKSISYYNPKLKDPEEYSPTSYWAYNTLH